MRESLVYSLKMSDLQMKGGNYHVLLCIGFIKNVNGYTILVSIFCTKPLSCVYIIKT